MTMSFRLFLVCSFFLLGRPQDILTFLQPARPALVLTVLAMAALVFGDHRQELSAALSTRESKRYLLFFLIMIVGIPFAAHKGLAFGGVIYGYLPNVLFFILLVAHVTTLHRLKSLVWVACLAALMYSFFGGLLQGGGEGRFQVLGYAFDPNDTAYVLLSLFPLCLFFIRFDEGLLKKVIAVAAVCSAVLIILQTGSRGGLIGLGTVLLILLLTNAGGIGKGYKLLFVVMLASTVLIMRDRIDIDRYLSLSDVATDYNVSEEGGRFELWQSAIDLTLANPITGVGVECFPFAHLRARQLAEASYLRWQYPHNSYLQVACEVGLIGFTVFVLITLRSVFTFSRVSRMQVQLEVGEPSEFRTLGGLMLIGFVGLLASGFFLSQGYSIFSTFYFALAATMERLRVAFAVENRSQSLKGQTERSVESGI